MGLTLLLAFSVAGTEAQTPEAKPVSAQRKAAAARSWWSWAGIAAGLAASALSVPVAIAGVATQGVALWLWIEQTDFNRPQAERDAATLRARLAQWSALALMVGGATGVVGGLIGATYAYGAANAPAQTAAELR